MASLTTTLSASPPSCETGALQGMADPETQMLWYSGENAQLDVCIRLVRGTINNEVDDGRTLAYLMVYSNRLEACSSYFTAALSQRWRSKRKQSPQELTFHVHWDVRLYTDCFSRMYKRFMVSFANVKYSLQLLAAATHLGYDNLMSSTCIYLASVYPWSHADETRIRKSLFSEDFPSGYAADLLVMLESRLTKEDVRPLITRYMQCFKVHASASSETSASEGEEFLIHLLKSAGAGVRENSLTPTFEQEVVTIVNEELTHLLVQANEEVGTAVTVEEARGMISRLEVILHVLDMLVVAGVADEAVKCFVRYSAWKCLRITATAVVATNVSELVTDVTEVSEAFAFTVLRILKEVVQGSVYVGDRDRSALLIDWLPLLQWLCQQALGDGEDVCTLNKEDYCEGYEEVTKVLVPTLSESEQIKLFRFYEVKGLF